MVIRKATINDIKKIQRLINSFASRDLMIPRSLNELYENIRDFFVYVDRGRILGCSALHIVGWEGLAEIKSLAVDSKQQGKGIGSLLLSACLEEAKRLKVKRVFTLTYCPGFFKKFKFRPIDKLKLPHKIWAECCNCPKFPDCKETALIIDIK